MSYLDIIIMSNEEYIKIIYIYDVTLKFDYGYNTE